MPRTCPLRSDMRGVVGLWSVGASPGSQAQARSQARAPARKCQRGLAAGSLEVAPLFRLLKFRAVCSGVRESLKSHISHKSLSASPLALLLHGTLTLGTTFVSRGPAVTFGIPLLVSAHSTLSRMSHRHTVAAERVLDGRSNIYRLNPKDEKLET